MGEGGRGKEGGRERGREGESLWILLSFSLCIAHEGKYMYKWPEGKLRLPQIHGK